MEWQPIETAPKDGKRILLFNCGEHCIGYRPEDCPDDGAVVDFTRCYPTHWMPLSQPLKLMTEE